MPPSWPLPDITHPRHLLTTRPQGKEETRRDHLPGHSPASLTRITSCTARGGMTVCWLGLCMADPILASSLFVAMPAEAV